MKFIINGIMSVFFSLNVAANSTELLIQAYEDFSIGSESTKLVTNHVTIENAWNHRIVQYLIHKESVKICYTGDVDLATRIIRKILSSSSSESWQELEQPSVQGTTILYPFSYERDGGHSDDLQITAPLCP